MLKSEVVGSLQHGKGKVLKVRAQDKLFFKWTQSPKSRLTAEFCNRNTNSERSSDPVHSVWLESPGAASTRRGARPIPTGVQIAASHATARRRYAIKIIDKTHHDFDLPSLEKEIMILKKATPRGARDTPTRPPQERSRDSGLSLHKATRDRTSQCSAPLHAPSSTWLEGAPHARTGARKASPPTRAHKGRPPAPPDTISGYR